VPKTNRRRSARRRAYAPEPVNRPVAQAGASPRRQGWRFAAQTAGSWVRLDTLIVCALVVAALALYCWRLSEPGGFVWDEDAHTFTAIRLLQGDRNAYLWNTLPSGGFIPSGGYSYEWQHPALPKLFTQAGLHLLGIRPIGWRLPNVLFGAAGIGLCFVLGRVMFNRRVGLIAALLLLLDGMWFVMSRAAMNDIFVCTFLLVAYLGLYLYLRDPAQPSLDSSDGRGGNPRYLCLTGAGLGLALASKWSGA
jgi:dolichyl-phosphate-mannose-protein mannosyltransferase